MVLGIDASNIVAGGGVTHLVQTLAQMDPVNHGFEKVILWARKATLDVVSERPWLVKAHDPRLERGLVSRVGWQQIVLPRLARQAGCALLFCPGGLAPGDFRPFVTMSRNLLPFESSELRRYGLSATYFRLNCLRRAQVRSCRAASGVIFLTNYAREAVIKVTGPLKAKLRTISHGVHTAFFAHPRIQRAIEPCTASAPLRLVYVSSVDVYKHHWHVAEAVACLRSAGYPVTLDLIGPAHPKPFAKLIRTLRDVDPNRNVISYKGPKPYESLPEEYRHADVGVFASSCENLPNILLEMMASGLPIACSNRGPMLEVLGEGGVYFDPERPEDVAKSIRQLIDSSELRATRAEVAFRRAQAYTWERCADETLTFLSSVAIDRKLTNPCLTYATLGSGS